MDRLPTKDRETMGWFAITFINLYILYILRELCAILHAQTVIWLKEEKPLLRLNPGWKSPKPFIGLR